MCNAVSNLRHLIQLGFPNVLWRQVETETIPILQDEARELRERDVAQRMRFWGRHVDEAFVGGERRVKALNALAPIVAEKCAEFDIDHSSQPSLQLPEARIGRKR